MRPAADSNGGEDVQARGCGRSRESVVVAGNGAEVAADAERRREVDGVERAEFARLEASRHTQYRRVDRDQRDVAQACLHRRGDFLTKSSTGAYGFDAEQRAGSPCRPPSELALQCRRLGLLDEQLEVRGRVQVYQRARRAQRRSWRSSAIAWAVDMPVTG